MRVTGLTFCSTRAACVPQDPRAVDAQLIVLEILEIVIPVSAKVDALQVQVCTIALLACLVAGWCPVHLIIVCPSAGFTDTTPLIHATFFLASER